MTLARGELLETEAARGTQPKRSVVEEELDSRVKPARETVDTRAEAIRVKDIGEPKRAPSLDVTMHDSMHVVTLVLAALYAVFVVLDLVIAVPPQHRVVSAASDATLAILCLAAHVAFRRGYVPPARSHAVAGLLAIAITFNILIATWRLGEPDHSTYLILLAVGCGAIFLSTRWTVGITVLAFLGFLGLAVLQPDKKWVTFGLVLFAACVLGVLLHVVRVRTLQRLQSLVVAEATRKKKLESAVSALQRSEERIGASLREKEALLREIHHRVKNNLQVTSGLLLLQSKQAKDEATRELFVESMSRVKSMALVHEKLYESKNLANINFEEYVNDLVRDLAMSYGAAERHVSINTDVPQVTLDVDTCVNLGLILNELVSNAFKHAFPGGRAGQISVTLVVDGQDSMRLCVRDDGIGLPPGVMVEGATTMGLQLVAGLAKQVDGTLITDCDSGTQFCITFAAPRRAQPSLIKTPHEG